MPAFFNQPIALVTPNVASGENGWRVSSVPFVFVGGKIRLRQVCSDGRQISVAGLANLATTNIWTPAAGFYVHIYAMVVVSSVAGPLTLKVGNNSFCLVSAVANVPYIVPIPPDGYCQGVADEVVKIFNNTGGATNLSGMIMGMELS